MAYRVYQHNKKSGVTYVYEAVSTWDKDKKTPVNKQVCIGKLDKDTGEFIPSKRLLPVQAAVRDPEVAATVSVVGPSLILDHITSESGIGSAMEKAFPETYKELLTLAYFIVCSGNQLSYCENWAKSHRIPAGFPIAGRGINKLLMGQTEAERQIFLQEWMKVARDDTYCYDVTSVTSYAEANEFAKHLHNRDDEELPQINLAMLIGQKSKLPVYYSRMTGNISDDTILSRLIKKIGKMDIGKMHFVLDRSFYSEANIDGLFDKRHKFTIAVPNHIDWVQSVIDEFRDEIEGPKYYKKIGDETIYMAAKPWNWGGKGAFAHVYYNSYAAAEAFDKFTGNLLTYMEELETKNYVEKHVEFYKRYFTITETPKRGRKVDFNDAEIQKYRKRYTGFSVILTNEGNNPLEVLKTYREKDMVENCFDDLKNQIDMKRLMVHRSTAMDGRLFVQFLALIYICFVRNIISENDELKNYTVHELISEMDTLSEITYSGKYGSLLAMLTNPQKKILTAFNIDHS